MPSSSKRLFVAGLLGAALIFHLAVALQDFQVLAKNGFLYDDSFYAFKIAQNIAHGNGASFDGTHPTNGFQPLYVSLLVPFYWFFGSDLIAPIYGALLLSALLTAFTAVLLFRIVNRYAGVAVALIAGAIWTFSPVVTKQAANGLETSLALFFFASVVYIYISRIRPVQTPARRNFVIIGALIGLAVLARIDEIFLALAIALDYLLLLRRRHASPQVLKGVFVSVIAALVAYSPWLVYNALTLGGLFQDSGTATRYLSLAYAPFFELGSPQMASTGPSAGFVWGHVVHSLSVMKLSPPVHAWFRGAEKLGAAVGAGNALRVLADILGLVVAVGFLALVLFRKRNLRVKGFDEVQFLLVFAGAIVAAYSLYVFGAFFFVRYYYPIYFVLCIYAGLLLEEGLRRLPPIRALAVLILTLYLGAFGYMAYTCACRSHPIYCFYDVARWVEENSTPDDTIGVFQSGAIGYFSNRRVINLDGKVNKDALEALKNGRLGGYLRSEGVDIVLDNKNVLDLFLVGGPGHGGPGDPLVVLGLHPIETMSNRSAPGWAAYRVNGFASSEGSGSLFNGPRSLQNK